MNIEKFCSENNLGNVTGITKLTGGFMHKMFKVETDKGVYTIKVLNQEIMKKNGAYNNFVLSETISNLAKENGIPVSSALKIDNDFITKYGESYFMVFDFVNGKTLNDEEISTEYCKQIGGILAKIHSLDYSKFGFDTKIKEDHFYVDWEKFTKIEKFNSMNYKNLYLTNYSKYYLILKDVVDKFNKSNTTLSICHRDMNPRNVMWSDGHPVVIDWESASLSNPYRELLEDALCWSGFLSNKFSEEKFVAVINEYSKSKDISNIDWYAVALGNLIGRFGWLDYNLKRSLGLKSNDDEEMKLAEKEVSKTIDEINRYFGLIEPMCNIFGSLTNKKTKNYDEVNIHKR